MLVPMRQNKKLPSRDEYNRTTLIYALRSKLTFTIYTEKKGRNLFLTYMHKNMNFQINTLNTQFL